MRSSSTRVSSITAAARPAPPISTFLSDAASAAAIDLAVAVGDEAVYRRVADQAHLRPLRPQGQPGGHVVIYRTTPEGREVLCMWNIGSARDVDTFTVGPLGASF